MPCSTFLLTILKASPSRHTAGPMEAMVDQEDVLHDPLRLDLRRQTQKFLTHLGAESPYATTLQNVSSKRALLDTLSRLLLVPQHTLLVATLFRPILLDLCARWLQHDGDKLEKFEVLCLLLEIYQELSP